MEVAALEEVVTFVEARPVAAAACAEEAIAEEAVVLGFSDSVLVLSVVSSATIALTVGSPALKAVELRSCCRVAVTRLVASA